MKAGFYEYLKKEIQDSRFNTPDFDSDILYLPEYFKMLCDLLDEEEVYVTYGHMINAALAYFVIPNDIIPEDVYGAWGYMDDMFVCAYVLKKIYSDFPDKVELCWPYPENFAEVLERTYSKSEKLLEEKGLKQKVLNFSGLDSFINK